MHGPKLTAFEPPNRKMETLKFYLTAKVIFSRGFLSYPVQAFLTPLNLGGGGGGADSAPLHNFCSFNPNLTNL